MPVEIKELIIKATVTDDSTSEKTGDDSDMDAIVARCVEQVLEIIERKKER